MVRSIGIVTSARSDWGIYRPVLDLLDRSPDIELRLYVTGMHLSAEFGLTVEEIETSGFEVTERVHMLLSSDSAEAIAKSIGVGVVGFAQVFGRAAPDLLVVLGDRFDMLPAVLAAMPHNIPVAHLHGGERTEGIIDELIRHAVTKLSHLHFVSTETYRRRVIQLGEEPWRVTVSGAPSLDNLNRIDYLDREDLERTIGVSLAEPPLLVTFHPVTLHPEQAGRDVEELLAGLEGSGRPVVFTYPNADTGARAILDLVEEYVGARHDAWLVVSLGTMAYFSLMRCAAAMVGNSSSGLIEAASFGLPVVNIGIRQRGRIRGKNVVDVDAERHAIADAIERVTAAGFRESIEGMENPYGDGSAARRIVDVLESVELDARLIEKAFHDLPLHPG